MLLRLVPVVLAAFLARDPAITLRLTPHLAFAPADVRATIRIPRADSNRGFCAQIVSDVGAEFLTCRELEGAKAATVYEVWFRALPPGEYQAQAYVIHSDRSADFTAWIAFSIRGFS